MPGLITPQSPVAYKRPSAPKVVGSSTKKATRPTTALPEYLSEDAKKTIRRPFNADEHLSFQPPESIIKMKDIGLEGHGISPNAVSAPFQLFSKDAIEQMRAEVFSDVCLRECQYGSAFTKNMVRGMGPV